MQGSGQELLGLSRLRCWFASPWYALQYSAQLVVLQPTALVQAHYIQKWRPIMPKRRRSPLLFAFNTVRNPPAHIVYLSIFSLLCCGHLATFFLCFYNRNAIMASPENTPRLTGLRYLGHGLAMSAEFNFHFNGARFRIIAANPTDQAGGEALVSADYRFDDSVEGKILTQLVTSVGAIRRR